MIKITTDSTADIQSVANSFGIEFVPLKVLLDTETYLDGVNVTPAQLVEFEAKTKILPKTSAPSIEDYNEFFQKKTENGDTVIHISLSEKCSASHNNARLASENFNGKVFVVDSKALCCGQGLLCLKACDLVKEGLSAEEIVKELEVLRDKTNTSFVPDRLDYLYKGGRCSKMEMFGGNILKIHPMIAMQDGQLVVKKKFRGNMKICAKQYFEELRNTYPDYDDTRCVLANCLCDKEFEAYMKGLVEEIFSFKEIILEQAGSTITSHCGKGTIALMFIAK